MKTTRYTDGELAFETYGEDSCQAIIFIHGASSDQRIWKYLVEEIQDRYLITFDLLGHGISEKPEITYSIIVWANNVRHLIDHLSLEKVSVVAHSFGVQVAKQFYHIYPDFVNSIVIVDGNLKQVLSFGIYNWMKTTLDRPDYEEYMRALNKKSQPFCLKKKDSDLVNEGVLNTPKYVLKGQLESMTEKSDLEIEIRVPVLAFYAKSHEWNDEAEQYLKSHVQHLELHIWEDVSHFMMLEKHKDMAKLISIFVEN